MISKVPLFLHQRAAPTYSTPTRPADKADRNKKMTDSNSAAAKHSAVVQWRAGVLISNIAKVDCHFELQKNLVKQHQVKLASTRQPEQPPRHARSRAHSTVEPKSYNLAALVRSEVSSF